MDHLLYLAETSQEILSDTFMEFTFASFPVPLTSSACNFLTKVSEVNAIRHVFEELRGVSSSFSNCSGHPLSLRWAPTLESQLVKVPASPPVPLKQPLWAVARATAGRGPGSQSEPRSSRRTCGFQSRKPARDEDEEPHPGHMPTWLSLSEGGKMPKRQKLLGKILYVKSRFQFHFTCNLTVWL